MKAPGSGCASGVLALANILLFVGGMGTALYGFAAIAYHEPAVLVAGFIAAGAAMVAAAVGIALYLERRLRAEEALAAAATPPAAAEARRKRAIASSRVLAEWTLPPDEWRAFHAQEAAALRRKAVEQALVGTAFGGSVAWFFAGGWAYAAIGALAIGGVMGISALAAARRMRGREPRDGAGVVIRRNEVRIDGEVRPLRDGDRYLSAVKVRDELPQPVLELAVRRTRYERNGSRRAFEDLLRVPIPRGREEEARRIAAELRATIVDDGD